MKVKLMYTGKHQPNKVMEIEESLAKEMLKNKDCILVDGENKDGSDNKGDSSSITVPKKRKNKKRE